MAYYHQARTHLGLDKDAPDLRRVEPPRRARSSSFQKSAACITATSVRSRSSAAGGKASPRRPNASLRTILRPPQNLAVRLPSGRPPPVVDSPLLPPSLCWSLSRESQRFAKRVGRGSGEGQPAVRTASPRLKCGEELPRFTHVRRVEAFAKRAVDLPQHLPRLTALVLLTPQAAQAHRGAQLQ